MRRPVDFTARKRSLTLLPASTDDVSPSSISICWPRSLTAPAWEVWAALLRLALLSTALAYILYFRILATADATNLLVVTFLFPVSAILLGEQLLPRQIEGMVFLGVGLAVIDGRLLSWFGRRQLGRSTVVPHQ